MGSLIFQGQWAFLFLGPPIYNPKDASTLTPLASHLFARLCSKVFGVLQGLEGVWLGM